MPGRGHGEGKEIDNARTSRSHGQQISIDLPLAFSYIVLTKKRILHLTW